MAFKKDKAVQAAQDLISKGKLKEAVAEFSKIAQYDPRDANVLNTLGDLYVRLSNIPEATRYYTRLADVYVKEGFLVRGIAMFKKISKLDPSDTNAQERLADLYTMQGLLNEARAQYLQLAEAHLKANATAPAMQVLQKVVDLDPDNLRVQDRLASLYERQGQANEAAQLYRRVAERQLFEGQVEESLERLEKALALAPNDPHTLLLHARALKQARRVDDALAALEKIPNLEEQPEALDLLLRVRLEAGQTEAASELAEKLFAADPTRFTSLLQLARHAATQQDGARALELLQRVAEQALERDPGQLLEVAEQVADALPDSPAALDLMARAARQARDQTALINALSRQARAAAAAQDFARAKELCDQLVTLEPNNMEFVEFLRRMREAVGEPVGPAEVVPEAVVAPAGGMPQLELDEETQAYLNATMTDIDLFSSYGMSDKAIELAQQVVGRIPEHPAANEKLLDLYIGSGNHPGVVEVAGRLAALYRQAGNYGRVEELNNLARQYGEHPPAEAAPAPEAPAPVEVQEAQEVDLSAEWAALAAPEEAPAAAEPADIIEAPTAAFSAKEAGEEIDFYIAQGLLDLARDTLARYEKDFPGEPALAELRAKVEAAAPAEAPPTEVAPAAAEAKAGGTYDLVLEEQPKEAAPAGAGMSSQDFFADLAGELDTALAQAPPPPVTPGAPAAKPAPPPPPAAPAAAPAGALAELFQEFKSEMGEVEEVEDIETHYNLGIAYKEMGLFDEAISEFQKAAKAAEKQNAHLDFFQCCTLLGVCFIERGHPQIAVRWYERALRVPGLDEEAATALRYDMGLAHEQAGNRKAALDCFMEVYGSNVDYRDVGERIRALQGA
ncbi:MAG: tetratricopeptide repeat protein [Acidobacteria bacterium]|nr:tetratricopeptide repeat protein [Acidobacteriota bacterium]